MKASLLFATVLPLLCAPAAAVTVITNFAPGTQNFAASMSGPTGGFGPFGSFPDRAVAFSFTTGPVPAVLDSMTFSVNLGNASLSPIAAWISTGSPVTGGHSPAALGSVVPASASPVTQILTLSPAGGYALDAGTTYWIHLTVPNGGAVYALNNGNAPATSSGWMLGNTWSYEPDFGGSWTELSSGPQARISLEAQLIPEPAFLSLAGAAAALLLLRRRHLPS
jgi:hypothetical protein